MFAKHLKNKVFTTVAIFMVITILLPVVLPQKAHAVTAAGWHAGRIIDDAVFYNKSSMTANQIQQFLNAKVPVCDRNRASSNPSYQPPWTCLKEYQENIVTKENNIGRFNSNGTPYNVPGGKSAGQIIWEVAQEYGINPQVLIVMLQKEQGLITDNWPWKVQYQKAMGYACPDTAPCDTQYYGFYNQVSSAAWQLKRYIAYPNNYNFKAGVSRYIQYSPNAACGGSQVYIENPATAALYNYTPYQPNAGALANMYGTADCGAYGNRNFWRYFNDWFGNSLMPFAFQSLNGGPIYLYVSGYRVEVTQMAILQDHGISPESIQKVSDSVINSAKLPTPEENISTQLGSLVKTTSDLDDDGGSIYLVSVGKKYQIKSMQQFAEFGFKEESIKYYPAAYVKSIKSDGYLSEFVATPKSIVFKIEAAKKRIIFTYNDFISYNPSGVTSVLSYYLVDQISSSNPLISKPALIKYSNSEKVYLYSNNSYYNVPNYNVYSCAGFDYLKIPVFRTSQNNYVSPITPSNDIGCIVKINGEIYVLNGSNKIKISDELGSIDPQEILEISNVVSNIPTRNSSLKKFVKDTSSAAVWEVTNGKRKLIPTYNSLVYFGALQSGVDIINSTIIEKIDYNGISLANGQLVKTQDNGTVYVIHEGKRYAYRTSNTFVGFGNSWSNIATIDKSKLDQSYPIDGDVGQRLYINSNKTLLLNQYDKCYVFDEDMASSFNIDLLAISTGQKYDETILRNLTQNTCSNATKYVKLKDQSLVYLIESGKKYSINSYSQLLSLNSGKEPVITEIEPNLLITLVYSGSL